MRLAIFSHSNVNLRQQIFWKEFSKLAEVLVISPREWGNQIAIPEKDDNYELYVSDIENKDHMRFYYFHSDAFKKVASFNPDIILHQGEFYTYMCDLSQQLAKQLRCKFVNFCWDNINQPTKKCLQIIKNTDLNICGNKDCKKLYHGDIILPQVGIDTDKFSPKNYEKIYDCVYIGRDDPSKGTSFIKEAYPTTKFFSNLNYDEVSEIINKSKLFITYPFDTEFWKEQFNYTIAESLSCETPVICSDAGAIPEWFKNSGAFIINQKDFKLLKYTINFILKNYNKIKDDMAESRKFIIKNYSNKVIAKRLYNAMKVI